MEDYKLNAILESLREKRGGGTWYISLYIRPDKSINSIQNRIVQEISEAESIKSDDTRDRVQSSLQKIRDQLSSYKQTPENGVAIFATPDDITTLDELPFDCPENRYHCGKEFVLEPLDASFESGGTYGLIVVERGRAAVGVLSNGRITDVLEKESGVMGKTRAGGQSAQRFARIRERQLHQFFTSVKESSRSTFSNYDLDGIVIGGTLSSAKDFSDEYTRHDWDVLGTYSVDHGDEQGLEELVVKAEDTILDDEQSEERENVEQFLSALTDETAEYGRERVVKAIERGRVDTLLLSTEIDVSTIQNLSEKAENFGSDVVVVSPSFEEARMFQELGGIGAILRW